MDATKWIVVSKDDADMIASRADLVEAVTAVVQQARSSLFGTSDRNSRKKDRKARMRELQRKAFLGK